MTPPKRPLLPILLVLAILSLIAYLVTDNTGDQGRREASAKRIRSAPDIALDGIREAFIENGRKKWTLKAASAHLSRSSQQTQVNNIDATFFTADGKTVHVAADSGILALDTKDVKVSGNVIIQNQDIKIYTQSLRYQAERHIITTDGPVRMESPSLRLTGDRLRYDLLSTKAELTGNVNGIINQKLTRQ